jgi:predicted nucleic acid-binding protein
MSAQELSYDCVIDASVGIKLFLVEALSKQARALFAHLTDPLPAQFFVPDLFFVECTNILWKYVRRFGYPSQSARQDVADLVCLPVQAVPTGALVGSALELAIEHGLTAYDASYVALADRLALPLVTADERLVRSLEGVHLDVRSLVDWP